MEIFFIKYFLWTGHLILGKESYKTVGWANQMLPLEKWEMENLLAMLTGGGGYNNYLSSFNTRLISFSHTEGGSKKVFNP